MKLDSNRPVVMVDDNDVEVLIVKKNFQKSNLQNTFLNFSSGMELLEHLEKCANGECEFPGLVLLDINMPGLTGHETLERVRTDERFKETPIILMLTNSNKHLDEEKAIGLGANGYIVKSDNAQEYIDFFNSLCA